MKNFVANLPAYIAYVRKALVQLLGMLGALLALGLLPDPYAGYVSGAIAVLTVVLHYITPNADKPGDTPAIDSDEPDDVDELEDETPDEFAPSAQITASEIRATDSTT